MLSLVIFIALFAMALSRLYGVDLDVADEPLWAESIRLLDGFVDNAVAYFGKLSPSSSRTPARCVIASVLGPG